MPAEDGLDLTGEAVGPAAGAAVIPENSFVTRKHDPEQFLDQTRRRLAILLVVVLAVLAAACVAVVGALVHDHQYESAVHLAEVLYGPIVALVGSAVGFYFGASSRKA
ncbi:MAG TPA: hypothetical protein VGO31_11815 [Microbacteriaceae bacterium]|nr:hypothetical protein [Microbacteriaceae bacterium]